MRKLLISAALVFALMAMGQARGQDRPAIRGGRRPATNSLGDKAKTAPLLAPAAGESALNDPEPLPQVKLPSLSETVTGLVGKLLQGGSRAGVIVKVDDKKVYVDLGAGDGAKVGDELEVVRKATDVKHPVTGEKLGEERDVAGKLKVVSVQPKLSVCDLLSGQAEQKNDQGEFNKVLPAQSQSKIKVRLAKAAVDANASLSEAALPEALTAACAGSARLELADAAQAEYELRAQAKKAETGAQITLMLIELKSGRTVAQSEGVHKTVLTAADLGLKMAVVAETKANLQLDPIYEAAKTVTRVRRAENALIFDAVGPSRHIAVAYANGKIIVAQRRSFSRLKDYDELEASFSSVCDFLRKGQATLPADLASQTWLFNSRAYTDSGNVFRELWLPFDASFHSEKSYDYVMAVPKIDIQEARLVSRRATGFRSNDNYDSFQVSVDDKGVFATNSSATLGITGACSYGDHRFCVSLRTVRNEWQSYLILQVRTAASVDVWPSFRDSGNKSLGTVSPICGSVNELVLPAEMAQ